MQSGFSLIETLVALLLLSFSLVIFIHAEQLSFSSAQSLYFQFSAENQVENLAEEMRICHEDAICRANTMDAWQLQVEKIFPNSRVETVLEGERVRVSLQIPSGGMNHSRETDIEEAIPL